MNLLSGMSKTFVYVMTGITISTAVFITIFHKEASFSILLLWQIILMSILSALGDAIYYAKKELSKQQMKFRIICHYLYINIIVLGGAFCFGWLKDKIIPEALVMLLMIALVYLFIMIYRFHYEEKMAENLNRRLRKYYPSEEDKDI